MYHLKELQNRKRIKILLKKLRILFTPRWMKLTSTFEGGLKVSGLNRSGYGGRGVYLFGEELEYELHLMDSYLKTSDVVVDIGANVGAYTVKSAAIAGDDGLVIAIEPTPEMAAMNLFNIIQNSLSNVRLRVACVSDQPGQMAFWMRANKPNSFTLVPTEGAACFNSKVTTLDIISKEEGLVRLDFLKIDAEGVENEILEGGANTIANFKPIILVEATITEFPSPPDNYLIFQYKESHNLLLVHKDSGRILNIKKAGFVKRS